MARGRCLVAATWFETTMERLRLMSSPTRVDLENAARLFFQRLQMEVHGRTFAPAHPKADLDKHIAGAEERIAALDGQLEENGYDHWVRANAASMCATASIPTDHLDADTKQFARHLAARAERAKCEYLIHQFTSPATVFAPSDGLWVQQMPTVPGPFAMPRANVLHPIKAVSVGAATERSLERRRIANVGDSMITELARVLGWLEEEVGRDTPLPTVSFEQMRDMRDGLERLDVRLRGRDLPFRKRQTNAVEHWIVPQTSRRYVRSLQAFFTWAHDEERLIPVNPATGLKIGSRKGTEEVSPPPFTAEELQKLFATPVFQGVRSAARRKEPGPITARTAHWWSLVTLLHTGMRAGELAQLMPSDLVFDEPVPHIKVRVANDDGAVTKTVKNEASIRDVPIVADLLTLGLREFVEGRRKRYPKRKLFVEFRTGTGNRKSDGLTKFWSGYIKAFDLWKPGRATHVARHTVAAWLRENGVGDEDIAAIVGHSTGTMTSKYGGNQKPLTRKAEMLAKLNYGFDVVDALGGPFDPKRHSEWQA